MSPKQSRFKEVFKNCQSSSRSEEAPELCGVSGGQLSPKWRTTHSQFLQLPHFSLVVKYDKLLYQLSTQTLPYRLLLDQTIKSVNIRKSRPVAGYFNVMKVTLGDLKPQFSPLTLPSLWKRKRAGCPAFSQKRQWLVVTKWSPDCE